MGKTFKNKQNPFVPALAHSITRHLPTLRQAHPVLAGSDAELALRPLYADTALPVAALANLLPKDTYFIGTSNLGGESWVTELLKTQANRKLQVFGVDLKQTPKVTGLVDDFSSAVLIWPVACKRSNPELFKVLAAIEDECRARVQTILSLVDMQQGTRESLEKRDYTFRAVIKAEKLGFPVHTWV